MRRRSRAILSLMIWLHVGGVAIGATAPAKIVEQFLEAHLQGRFAEARSLLLENANLSGSLFGSWLFGGGGAGVGPDVADIFLSRKFAQSFRYSVTDTAPGGSNQAYVTALRSSPSIVHLYTWALAPKRGAAPYEIIDALDVYLTKVNFPVEESRMQFTLIQEAGNWLIGTITDEKFALFRQQAGLQAPLSPAGAPLAGAPAAPGMAPGSVPGTTTTSSDIGRQTADAQFYATLQGFNSTHQAPAANRPSSAAPQQEQKPWISRVFGFGLRPAGDSPSKVLAKISDESVKTAFYNIRDAISRYAVSNNGVLPGEEQIYNWDTLRRFVNQYGSRNSKQLPATEDEAGFSFVRYRLDPAGRASGDYTLLVELHEESDGSKRVEVTPYGVDRVR